MAKLKKPSLDSKEDFLTLEDAANVPNKKKNCDVQAPRHSQSKSKDSTLDSSVADSMEVITNSQEPSASNSVSHGTRSISVSADAAQNDDGFVEVKEQKSKGKRHISISPTRSRRTSGSSEPSPRRGR